MVNPIDELTRVLPERPASQQLPRQQRHRAELLTIIAAGRPQGRASRHQGLRGWLVPALAAAAVAAIALVAVTVATIVGGTVPASPAANPAVRAGRPTAATARPTAGGPAAPAAGRPLTRTRHWSVPAGRFGAVVVNVTRGSVAVTAGSAASAAITATPDYHGQAPVLSSQVVNGTLAVTARCPQEPRCQVAVTLELPAGVDVRATSGLGDVRVTGLHGSVVASSQQGDVVLTQLSGEVSVSDELGDVTLTGVSGPVTATTDEGTVSATGLTAAQVALSSQDGNVTAAFAVPPSRVTASSQLGNVTLRLPPTTTYDVIVSTELGGTSIMVPQSSGSPRVIKASSELGSVTVSG